MGCIVAAPGFSYFSIHEFSRIFCKIFSFVCNSREPYVHDIEDNKVLQFLQIFHVEMGASMWSSYFLVEVAVKFGVLLAVPRNEARKKPEKPCKLCGIDMSFCCKKKLLKKKNGRFKFLSWNVSHYTLPLHGSIYTYNHDRSPRRKKNSKWTPVAAWILPRGTSYVTAGLTWRRRLICGPEFKKKMTVACWHTWTLTLADLVYTRYEFVLISTQIRWVRVSSSGLHGNSPNSNSTSHVWAFHLQTNDNCM